MEDDHMVVDENEAETTICRTSSLLLATQPGGSFPAETVAPAGVKFKGVVLQQNGNWGAQIYANHQRIWLGTFKTELSAAVAYDRAATKFRVAESGRNIFSSTLELAFQNLYSTESVLVMIRDGSYEPKLAAFLRSTAGVAPFGAGTAVTIRELFRKELTPSDVGQLNRLVIPKKHAVKFFPSVGNMNCCEGGDAGGGVMLEFTDFEERRWEFRYCYWKSSQSFVFTKGWNKFVKTNQLRSKDVVTFYASEERDGVPSCFHIATSRQSAPAEEPVFRTLLFGNGGGAPVDYELAGEEEGGDAMATLRRSSGEVEWGRKGSEPEEGKAMALETVPKKSIRLFGVQIGDR